MPPSSQDTLAMRGLARSTSPARAPRCVLATSIVRSVAFALAASVTAATFAEECSGPTCCLGGPWRGCNVPSCCNLVCAADPFCCDVNWDDLCSNAARDLCDLCLPRDCDGNGNADEAEYVQGAQIALRVDASRDDPPDAFCPQRPVGDDSLVVLTGPAEFGPRFFSLITPSEGPFRGVLAANATGVVSGSLQESATAPQLLAAIGSTAPTTLRIIGLTGAAGQLYADSTPDVPPSVVEVVSGGFNVDGIDVVRGRLLVGTPSGHSSIVCAGPLGAAATGTIIVGPDSLLVALDDTDVRGRLELQGASVLTKGVPLRGTSSSAWLAGSGRMIGDVEWQGTIEPGLLSIEGNLVLLREGGVAPARVIHRVAQNSLLAAEGRVALAGNLVIDATGAELAPGTTFPIVRATQSFGAARFDSVRVFGLPPQLAIITRVRTVSQPTGAPVFEVQGVVVAANSAIGFDGGDAYQLDLAPRDAVRGDLDDDGREDLAVTFGSADGGGVAIFRGTGKGLVQELTIPLAGGVRGIDAGDLDLDGRPDLCVALFDADALQVLRNVSEPGAFGFKTEPPSPIGDGPIDVALLDYYPDEGASVVLGGLDAFLAVEGEESFKIVKNVDGELVGANATTIPSPGGPPTSVGGGDIDNDRDDDAVGGSEGGTSVIPGGSGGTSSGNGALFFPTPNPVTTVTVADLSGDGVPEILASLEAREPRPAPPGAPPTYDSLALYRSTVVGIASSILDVGADAGPISVGDLDGDNDGDLVVASRIDPLAPRRARILRNDSTPWGFALNDVGTADAIGNPLTLATISIDGIGEDLVGLAQGPDGGANGRVVLLRTIDPPARGDLNGDGVVGSADLELLLSYWGFPGLSDLTRDGTTNAFDLAELLALWTEGA